MLQCLCSRSREEKAISLPIPLWLVSLVQSLLDVLIHLEAETLLFLQAGRWRVNSKGITFLRNMESRQKSDILATFNYSLCFQH